MPRQNTAAPPTPGKPLTLCPNDVWRLAGKTITQHVAARLRLLLSIVRDPKTAAGCRRTAQARICRLIRVKPFTAPNVREWSARLLARIALRARIAEAAVKPRSK